MKKSIYTFTITLVMFSSGFAQFNEHNFGLSINGAYTTSAEIFLNPNSSDLTIRNSSFELTDIFSPSIDFRYKLARQFIVGLSVEYVNKTKTAPNLNVFIGSQVVAINVEDGLRVLPVELSAFYLFPFSNEEFIFLMGGGIGYYRGEFTRKVSDAELSLTSRKIAIGIHVMTSMDYMLLENLSFRFEMKFRDPQYNVTNKYTKTEVEYNGTTIQLTEENFETKVNINGITFVLGAVFHF